MEIKTILIPVDGSEPAENAFRYGVGLAEENGGSETEGKRSPQGNKLYGC